MFDNIIELLPEITKAIGETLLMMGICLSAALVLGGSLGIFVFLTSRGQVLARQFFAHLARPR